MSERKGGAHKAERAAVYVRPETRDKLSLYAQRKNRDMVTIADMFIESGVETDFFDPNWEENRHKAKRVTEARASMEGACHRLASGTNKVGVEEFSCVAYSEEGVVRIKKLGTDTDIKDGKCFACGQDKLYKAGILVKDKRITELEQKIQMKAKQTNKVPICNGGAILTQEGTAFRSCRKRPGQTLNIETFCRKLSGGGTLPCALYAEVSLAEGPL